MTGTSARAGLISESTHATVLGTTGAASTRKNGTFYSGVSFELAEATRISAIGGQFSAT